MQTINDMKIGIDDDTAQMEYARTLYTLRETRKALLRRYEVTDESALLDRIRRGEVPVNPAYDHYLGAAIIEQTRLQLREELIAQTKGMSADAVPEYAIHLTFNTLLNAEYGDRMSEPVRLAQDALLLSFQTGLMMEVRYLNADEFSIRWTWGEAEFCVDTAPTGDDSFGPCVRLSKDDGSVQLFTFAPQDRDCWRHFSSLLDHLLVDPMLENMPSSQQPSTNAG